jgi:RHS repeat-associated protein
MSLFRVRSFGPATPHPPSSRRVGQRLSQAKRVVTTQFDQRSRPVSVIDDSVSVIALVDAGDPEAKPEPIPPKVVERYTYDPYGTTYIETWKAELPAGCTTPSECGCESDGAGGYWCESDKSAYGNPFARTAQRYDAGVGLYAFPFRSYSPALARFLQRDPLGYIDGPNLYEYARSMPTVLTDPLGLAAALANEGPGGGGSGAGGPDSGPGGTGGKEPGGGNGDGGGDGDGDAGPCDEDEDEDDADGGPTKQMVREHLERLRDREWNDWPAILKRMWLFAMDTLQKNMEDWLESYRRFLAMRKQWITGELEKSRETDPHEYDRSPGHDWVRDHFWKNIHSQDGLAGMSDTQMYVEAVGVSVVGGCAIYYAAPVAIRGGFRLAGMRARTGIHGPHHPFGRFGRLPHGQINWWRPGVKGSGDAWYFPFPKWLGRKLW